MSCCPRGVAIPQWRLWAELRLGEHRLRRIDREVAHQRLLGQLADQCAALHDILSPGPVQSAGPLHRSGKRCRPPCRSLKMQRPAGGDCPIVLLRINRNYKRKKRRPKAPLKNHPNPLPLRGGAVRLGPALAGPPPAATRQQAAKFRCPPLKGRAQEGLSLRYPCR